MSGSHLRALGREDLPERFVLAGRAYHRVKTFKHSALSAVGAYRCGDDRVVLKCYRHAPFLSLPLGWGGHLMAAHEAAVLRRVHDIPGVPRLRGRHGPTGLVRDFVPGRPLTRDSTVGEEFFPRLFRMLRRIHPRGVAYVDLEKAENVLVGGEGRPHLIDWQVAFYLPEWWPGCSRPARWLLRQMQEADMYHARKHFRRVMSDDLSERQKRYLRRKPWFVNLANCVHAPLKNLRRSLK